MLRKLLTGTLVAVAVLLVPCLGNIEALAHPQLWILVAIAVLAQLLQPAYRPIDLTAPKRDRGTASQIVWSVYTTQLAGVIEAVYFRYPESLQWTGVASIALIIIVLGLALRTWSVYELGRFFTWYITVQPDHHVITSGPYRIVRHPGYSGAFFMYVFTLVFIQAWTAALLAPALLLAAFWRRIRYEEEWLKTNLGSEYALYCNEVKALIPFVW